MEATTEETAHAAASFLRTSFGLLGGATLRRATRRPLPASRRSRRASLAPLRGCWHLLGSAASNAVERDLLRPLSGAANSVLFSLHVFFGASRC